MEDYNSDSDPDFNTSNKACDEEQENENEDKLLTEEEEQEEVLPPKKKRDGSSHVMDCDRVKNYRIKKGQIFKILKKQKYDKKRYDLKTILARIDLQHFFK